METNLLLTIAQLALGFAGFAGIVLAIVRGSGEPTDQVSVRILFQSSLGALFISLLTVAAAAAGVAEPTLWRAASVLIATYMVVMASINARFMKNLGARARRVLRTTIMSAVTVFWLPIFSLQIANASGALPNYRFVAFVLGLIGMLAVSAGALVRAVTIESRQRRDTH